MLALGITAPVGSMTCPCTEPLLCAKAAEANPNTIISTNNRIQVDRRKNALYGWRNFYYNKVLSRDTDSLVLHSEMPMSSKRRKRTRFLFVANRHNSVDTYYSH